MPYSPLGRGFLTGTAKPADQYDKTDMRRIAEILPTGGFGARYAGGNVPTWE